MIETIFKHTELGPIPLDWDAVILGNICKTSSGGTPSRSNKSYYKGSINWITTSELKDCYIYNSIEHISIEALRNSSAKLFPKGTILIAMYGATIGKLGILCIEAATNQACCAIFCNSIIREYLYYYLLFDRKNIIEKGCGAGQPNISQQIVNKFIIPIAPIKEQTRIASTLTSVDNLIMSISELIEKKKQIKQGAMQELLSGKKRLKGYTEPWVEYSLGDLLDYEQPTNYLVQSTEYEESGTPVLTAGKSLLLGYTNDKFGIFNELPVILFDDFTTASKFITYPFKVKSSAAKMLKLKNKKDNIRLIFEIMQVIDFPLTDHKRYWISQYSKIRVFLPSSQQEQSAIASVITSMDNEIIALEAKRDKYVAIKSGMMQQLLTGKIRLI